MKKQPSYNLRVMQIYQEFTMGIADRETSMTKFEDLLHEYGLLPLEEQLDRTITNENFIALLRMASEHRDVRSNRDPEVSKDLVQNVALTKSTGIPHYRLADSITQSCPICKVKVTGLYNRMQSLDNQTIPVDPPRCKNCMMKWVEEHFGTGINSNLATPYPMVSVDDTKVTPMDANEIEFFSQYEEQMKDFTP
jgi:hypothetical protein